MLPTIDAILNLFTKRRHGLDVIDEAIDNLHRSDDELERRLRSLRDQVDVYQRSQAPEDQPHV